MVSFLQWCVSCRFKRKYWWKENQDILALLLFYEMCPFVMMLLVKSSEVKSNTQLVKSSKEKGTASLHNVKMTDEMV